MATDKSNGNTNGIPKVNGFKKADSKIFDYDLTKEEELMPNRIADMFTGRSVFLTGGTGFLGKVVLEKMLRICPGVEKIYLLVRTKKGKEPKQRIEELFAGALFDQMKAERGADFPLKKVVGVSGDVSAPDLGLSDADRRLLCDNVSIVYHAAATIRFDESLKKAVLLNTRGTKLMLKLAEEMKKLELFCYVSTSYCHLKERILYEKPYPPPSDPHKVIKCVEWMEESIVDAMTSEMLGDLPNTYAFTKALAEGLVNEQMDKLPVIILRPSIVIPIWKDPLPGWTDNINGPTGLLIGAGKGVLRTMYCKQEGYADFLPVDVAVSGMFLAAWNYICNKDHQRVINLTSSSEIQVSWEEIISIGRKVAEETPLNGVAWYPGGSMKKSRLMHNIAFFFFQLLPAMIGDVFIFLSGNKPVLMRVQRRIQKGYEVFEYYANNQWDFQNDTVVKLRPIMNKKERKIFKIDADGLDLPEYFKHCIHAARIHVLNEPLDTLPAAKRHMRIMYWVDRVANVAFWGLTLWMVYSFSTTLQSGVMSAYRLVDSPTVKPIAT